MRIGNTRSRKFIIPVLNGGSAFQSALHLIEKMKRIKNLILKHRHFIAYAIVGGLTTGINFLVYYLLDPTGLNYIWRNSLAWIASVIASFFANRKFVFHSTAASFHAKFNEFFGFVASRAVSLLIENIMLDLSVRIGLSDNLAKVPVSIFVIILNYITGHIVFNGKNEVKKRIREISGRFHKDKSKQ